MLIVIPGLSMSAFQILPLIRSIWGLGKNYKEMDLLNGFCLTLPGHFNKDQIFSYNFLQNQLQERYMEMHSLQSHLASKLAFQGFADDLLGSLKSKKIILLGVDIGVFSSLQIILSERYPIGGLITFNYGAKPDFLEVIRRRILHYFWQKKSLKDLQKKQKQTKNPQKILTLSLFLENPRRLGYFSAWQIIQTWDFFKFFSSLKPYEQNKLKKIRMVCFSGSKDRLFSHSSLEIFKGLLHPITKQKNSDLSLSENSKLYNLAQNLQIKNYNKFSYLNFFKKPEIITDNLQKFLISLRIKG